MLHSPASVAEVASDAPLEEALAALAGEHAVMFPAGLVPAHHAVHHARLVVVSGLHVAAPRLGRAVVLLPPQVVLVPQPVSASIGISPAPTHHGHRLVTEPPQKKMGQAAKTSGCCQGNINMTSPDCVFPLTWRESLFSICLCSHLLTVCVVFFVLFILERKITKPGGKNALRLKKKQMSMNLKNGYTIQEEGV